MNIELEIERICQERDISPHDFFNRRTAYVANARRMVALNITFAHPEWAITHIGEVLGLAPGSARLGQGIFRF